MRCLCGVEQMRLGLDQSDFHVLSTRRDVVEYDTDWWCVHEAFGGGRRYTHSHRAATTAIRHHRLDSIDALESLVRCKGGVVLHGVHLSQC